MEDNHRLTTMIFYLKMELRDVQCEFDLLSKSVKLLTSRTQSLDNLLSERKSKGEKKKESSFFWKNALRLKVPQ